MSGIEITVLYAGILGIMAVGIGATAGVLRGKEGISVGDGGNQELLMRMRRHANFVENVPLALILIGFLEMQGVSSTVIHVLGSVLVLGRIMHFIGFGEGVRSVMRGTGAGFTALTIVVSSVWGIVSFF